MVNYVPREKLQEKKGLVINCLVGPTAASYKRRKDR